MKKIYIHKIHLILCFTSVLCFGLPINAQQNAKNGAADNNKKAWEIGIGATGLQMTRFNVINFHTNNKGGYTVGTNKKDFIFGGNLYFARELIWGIERSGFFNGQGKWAKGFENQMV